MKKFASAFAVALLALLATVGLAPSASAYPDVTIDLSVNRQTLYGGEQFTATATSDVACTWNLEWNGVTRGSAATTLFRTTFTAPDVTRVTKIPLHGTCSYAAPTARANARAAAAGATWSRTIVITVLPPASAVATPGGADLPNTGGPSFWFLAAGVALLITGAGAVVVARRRAENGELLLGQA
ncbi:LPXTG cell wall anchor domain-containing protein [Marmoricola sp. RAF53]|uniref:LPXTG cell wall anchor domain-containing protein n=1 Tax=Marmoricola sp. RAF53 TaxID=3233059 RepID=UPI003F9DEF5E